MNNTIAFLKRLRLARIVVVFLAGIFLLVSTACSNTPSATASRPTSNFADRDSAYDIQEPLQQHLDESYSLQNSPYPDSDKRENLSNAKAKSDRLINQAQKNVQKQVDNPKEAFENMQRTGPRELKKVGDKFNEISDSVGETVEDLKEGTERGSRNLKENIKSPADNVSKNLP